MRWAQRLRLTFATPKPCLQLQVVAAEQHPQLQVTFQVQRQQQVSVTQREQALQQQEMLQHPVLQGAHVSSALLVEVKVEESCPSVLLHQQRNQGVHHRQHHWQPERMGQLPVGVEVQEHCHHLASKQCRKMAFHSQSCP